VENQAIFGGVALGLQGSEESFLGSKDLDGGCWCLGKIGQRACMHATTIQRILGVSTPLARFITEHPGASMECSMSRRPCMESAASPCMAKDSIVFSESCIGDGGWESTSKTTSDYHHQKICFGCSSTEELRLELEWHA
jgi:hypothetical protein